VDLDWVALATFALAIVTAWLGWQARSQIALSREVESHRQAETRILEADPLDVELIDWDTRNAAAQPMLRIRVTAVGDKPVTAITGTIRSDERDESESQGVGSLAPGKPEMFTFRFVPFDLLDHCQIVIESHGLLGQRVIQTYHVRPDRMRDGAPGKPLYLERQEIVPNVDGATSSVVAYTE
jgi:hypothetical protein